MPRKKKSSARESKRKRHIRQRTRVKSSSRKTQKRVIKRSRPRRRRYRKSGPTKRVLERRTYTAANGARFKIVREKIALSRKRYLEKITRGRKKGSLKRSRSYVKDLKKEVRRFYKGKRVGKRLIVRIPVNINLKGRRLKQYIGFTPQFASSQAGIDKLIFALDRKLNELLKEYAMQQGFSSISVSGVELETKTHEVRTKTSRGKKKRK